MNLFFRKKRSGFSLVELLITLLIVPLLLAVFVHIVTKKIKVNDVAVGSFENNGVYARNITKEDCDRFNAVYVPASKKVLKSICVMKYNIRDGYYNNNWASVQKCNTG